MDINKVVKFQEAVTEVTWNYVPEVYAFVLSQYIISAELLWRSFM